MAIIGWMDLLEHSSVELFSFAKKNNISISNALVNHLANHLFHLPLSALAFLQLQALFWLLMRKPGRNLEDLGPV
jgi:hypothetical protein